MGMIQHMRDLQGHPEGTELIQPCKTTWRFYVDGFEHIYHVGSTFTCKSIIEAGLIAGGQGGSQGRQTCLFTAVGPYERTKRRSTR